MRHPLSPLRLADWPALDRDLWTAAQIPDPLFGEGGFGLDLAARHPSGCRAGIWPISRLVGTGGTA